MEKFNLPPQFKDVLDQNTALAGLVHTALGEFSPWLEKNNVKFFTEYTDHSLKHAEEVLKEADDLIREQCRGIITPADIATLAIATLLHDCAMHIGADSLVELVNAENRPLIQGFGDKPWKTLWLDFLAEARRFSGRKLMALFGNTEPVQYPSMDSQQMTGRDLLLIGEFLRRHHHRLAHEIALLGVPGVTDNKLRIIPTDDTKYVIDLAGVVARSHGMSIRDCVDYLKINYGSEKVYKGIHAVFMMVLLRIADILQIQSSRAPKQVAKVQKLQSPVSLGEWEMHHAIAFTNKNYDDPETIMVVAHPTHARTYLRIRRLLDQIQKELDASWTVIGEVYGYIPQFREIGLKYRRIKSNIDDIYVFSKQVKYVPTQASFEVADSDLLKLLIGPLYGHRPEIGIRELLQNSLDAVRELHEYQKQHPELKDIELTQQDGDIVISVDQDDDNKWWATVSDRGIGMTVETVKDYFLKAGASLRRNELWRKTFEDEQGKSKVLRSGRFGIGALATFLLGDEISLSTRHVTSSSKEGVEFTSRLDAESIELQHVERPVGTTIRIGLSEETKDILIKEFEHSYGKQRYYTKGDHWDWYCLSEPKTARLIEGKTLGQNYILSPANSHLPIGWHRIYHPDYEDIQWTYLNVAKDKSLHSNFVICNGIAIEEKSNQIDFEEMMSDKSFINGRLSFEDPSISVFDPDAKLPLNLQRTKLTVDQYPFQKILQEDVLKDFIAYLLVNIPATPLHVLINPHMSDQLNYSGIKHDFSGRSDLSFWFSTRTGVGLQGIRNHVATIKADASVIIFSYSLALKRKQSKSKRIDDYFHSCKKSLLFYKYLLYGAPVDSYMEDKKLVNARKINSGLNFAINFGRELDRHDTNTSRLPKRILISRQALELHKQLREMPRDSRLLFGDSFVTIKDYSEEWGNQDWIIWKTGKCPDSQIDLKGFAEKNPNPNVDNWPCLLAEFYFDINRDPEPSMLENIWNKVLGDPIIPYNLQERRKKFAHAYEQLKDHIQAHEALKRQEMNQ